ncbi:cation:proton antiporter [Balneolaceae bacterium ANBcel3]|nr:cation:proton antiporter [Balneolaceae bacterium ANBcel3]
MDFFSIAILGVYILLSLALLISLVRVIVGPTLPDRVVALDLIAFIVISFIAAYSISSGHPVYLDVAIVMALIAFLGTIAFARYVIQYSNKTKSEGGHV